MTAASSRTPHDPEQDKTLVNRRWLNEPVHAQAQPDLHDAKKSDSLNDYKLNMQINKDVDLFSCLFIGLLQTNMTAIKLSTKTAVFADAPVWKAITQFIKGKWAKLTNEVWL